MSFRQHGFSRTLPRNFTFSSVSEREPTTPECPSTDLDVPPPAPRYANTSRRSRPMMRPDLDVFFSAEPPPPPPVNSLLPDIPLPSIEIPSHQRNDPAPFPAVNEPVRFLAPPRGRRALRTPPSQIRPMSLDSSQHSRTSPGRRTGSVCSNASDSSAASIETAASRHSVEEGSCTSSESSDVLDPFIYPILSGKQLSSQSSSSNPPRQPVKSLAEREHWAPEMDSHLWNTYQLYLQDPTITPFKMAPGSIPPLGVTHRVARQARKSWERQRSKRTRVNHARLLGSRLDKKRSVTPTLRSERSRSLWPNSDAATRRRLRHICKRRFSIAPHYQRMLQSGSPEPFPDLFPRPGRNSSSDTTTANTAYATRDLGISLVSSTASGPLAELASGDVGEDWFNNLNDPIQQSSSSTTSVYGAGTRNAVGLVSHDSVPRLGSPFMYRTWGPGASRDSQADQQQTPRPRRGTIQLARPCQQQQIPPIPPLIKISAEASDEVPEVPEVPAVADNSSNQQKEEDDDDTEQQLENLLRQGKLPSRSRQGCMRIRNRGATTSSVRNLEQIFSPPPQPNPVSNAPWNLGGSPIKRLGSPFRVDGGRSDSSARFIKHAMSLSEPFASFPTHLTPTGKPLRNNEVPCTYAEAGISDAERVRREIMNMKS